MTAHEEYAKALFMLSEEMSNSDIVLEDATAAAAAISENPGYSALADTPALSVPEKCGLIKEAFSALTEEVRNLLLILCEHHSVKLFPAIAKQYSKLYNESRGIIPAEVISASPLKEEQMQRLTEKLSYATGKKIILKNTIDPSLLGGIKLRYSGIQLDGSLRSRLDNIEKRLKSTIL